MSAWSSATGKAQLSYAERLRQANKPSAPTRQEPSSSASAQRGTSHDVNKNSASNDATDSASGKGAINPLNANNARRQSASANVKEASTAHETTATPAKSEGPPVNIWEARRKQLAEKEAEKERERQATLAQQRKSASGANTSGSTGNNNNSPGNKGKQTPTNNPRTPRKGNERHSKGSANSSQDDRKNTKQANQASSRQSTSVPISSSASSTTGAPARSNADASSSKASSTAATPKSANEDTRTSADASSTSTTQQTAAAQTTQATRSTKSGSVETLQKPKADDKLISAQPSNTSSTEDKQPLKDSNEAQNALARTPPPHAMTINTAPAPIALHDDIPASPATVASAIEEVLKNGGVNGAQTEDDDAWLARIHMLNGGQNMPNFGGFGPNGISSLEDEAESQAAKKAERAVAAAWGAGKSVWNKTQQPRAADGKETVSASTASQSIPTNADTASVVTDSAPANGGDPETIEAGAEASQRKEKPTSSDQAQRNDAAPSQSKKTNDDKQQQSNSSKAKATPAVAANLPSFEDVNNWPSPLDAGKKPTEKPRPAASASTADFDAKPKQAKSVYETLDELQLKLAPGVSAQQGGSAGTVKKGGKQWVPILPEITLTSGQAGGRANKPQVESKAGKGLGKQQKKDGPKQAEKIQGQKKDRDAATKAANKAEKAQAKEGKGGEPKAKAEKVGAQGEGQSGSHSPARPEPTPASGDAAVADPTREAQKAVDYMPTQEHTPTKQARSGRVGRQPQAHLPPSGTNGLLPMAPNGISSPAASSRYSSQQPVYYVSSPATRMVGAPWMPYVPVAPFSGRNSTPAPYMYDSTPQTGSPLPAGVLGQLLGQIEFYFSEQNLVGDFFLRGKMDREGWVDIGVVAGFKRVKQIVNSEQDAAEKKGEEEMVLEALSWSTVLDVDHYHKRVRRRYGWQLYVLPSESEPEVSTREGNSSRNEDDEPALGVVAASGFGGALSPDQ